jgi:hypothetical protein
MVSGASEWQSPRRSNGSARALADVAAPTPCKTRAVWVPGSADELIACLGAGDLHESALLDGKRELTGGPEVVVDVCAMNPASHTVPIELGGERERGESRPAARSTS